jgi:hypothetical protein
VGFEGSEGLGLAFHVFSSANGVNADQPVLEIRVEGKTAPGPVLRVIDQFPFQRIHMHVVKFFDSLLQTPHVEIIETPLPKTRQRIATACKGQIQLRRGSALLATQAARDALLQNLNHRGRCSSHRLADEQVNVLGHDNISDQRKSVAVAHLTKNLDKNILGANRTQKRQTSIAGEGNEMQMAAPVVANEFVGHATREKSTPDPLKSKGSATRKSQTSPLALTYRGGMIPSRAFVNWKNMERVRHPRANIK